MVVPSLHGAEVSSVVCTWGVWSLGKEHRELLFPANSSRPTPSKLTEPRWRAALGYGAGLSVGRVQLPEAVS